MRFIIKHQEEYSRAELVLRTLFGALYIAIPHGILLIFVGIWSLILWFFSFWVILFTGKYPPSFFDFQVKYFHWNNRVNARLFNLVDGYPAFGLSKNDDLTDFDIKIPESSSRSLLLLRFFFAWLYVLIPHGFILYFRAIASLILAFLAFWVVLFTGKYPPSWHEFIVGTFRWSQRLNNYLYYMTDEYPPFTGKALANDEGLFEQRDN
ncbi:MAG: DUF4389 domain-containing protein [Vicingaceae bacterium]